MTHPNEELIGRWFLSQARGDPEAVRALLADDVVWHVPGRNLVSGDYRGPNEVIGFLARVRELSGGSARPPLLGVLANDTYAVALVRMFARGGSWTAPSRPGPTASPAARSRSSGSWWKTATK